MGILANIIPTRKREYIINMVILLTGRPGTGKSWVMLKLIEEYNTNETKKSGLIKYRTNGEVMITGDYDSDEEIFFGSDKLSMAAISSVPEVLTESERVKIFEGDRFTNTTMLQHDPIVINIEGDGEWGRKKRGSNQTPQRLKSMATRYDSYPYHFRVKNSDLALELVKELVSSKAIQVLELKDGLGQATLFD